MVDDRFRLRTARVVQLEFDELEHLHENASLTIDIDGMKVGFALDERQDEVDLPDDIDHKLYLSPFTPQRLYSGFSAHFYSVLDGYDLIVSCHFDDSGEPEYTDEDTDYLNPFEEDEAETQNEDGKVEATIEDMEKPEEVEPDQPILGATQVKGRPSS